MRLCRASRGECPQIPAFSGLGILLARVQTISAYFQFSDHRNPRQSLALGGFSVLNTFHQEADRENGLGLGRDGNIYVSYVGTSEVRVYNEDGGLLASFGQSGSRAGEFSASRGLWANESARLSFADPENF